MNLNLKDLDLLLELQAGVFEASRLNSQLQALESGQALDVKRDSLLKASSQLSAARATHEELQRDLRRAESDLEVVENRIKRDNERLLSTSAPKDIIGIQHELETLLSRKSDLEDSELALMEKFEASELALKGLADEREALSVELEELTNSVAAAVADLKSQLTNLQLQLGKVRSSMSPLVSEEFDKKALRGVAVGRLQGRTCGACNMGLTATAASDLLSRPMDELITCPECRAILVRS